jgi:hypothetical protein
MASVGAAGHLRDQQAMIGADTPERTNITSTTDCCITQWTPAAGVQLIMHHIPLIIMANVGPARSFADQHALAVTPEHQHPDVGTAHR